MADRECHVCKRIFRREQLGPLVTGQTTTISWDTRPKGPIGWRIGSAPQMKRFMQPQVLRACKSCGGDVPREPRLADRQPIWNYPEPPARDLRPRLIKR